MAFTHKEVPVATAITDGAEAKTTHVLRKDRRRPKAANSPAQNFVTSNKARMSHSPPPPPTATTTSAIPSTQISSRDASASPSQSTPDAPMHPPPGVNEDIVIEDSDTVACEWEDCGRQFTELQLLVNHIQDGELITHWRRNLASWRCRPYRAAQVVVQL
jgi:hypothetical protein